MNCLSYDLRKRIVEAYDAGEGTRQEIAQRFKVSLPMVKKLLHQRKITGTIQAQNHCSGRKPIFEDKDREWLRRIVEQQPDATLGELREACPKPCSIMTISRALQELDASYKKNFQSR
jgi:transposase